MKQTDQIQKVAAKCAVDVQRLRSEVEVQRSADIKKQEEEISAIRAKHAHDIQMLIKKHDDDMGPLKCMYLSYK